MSTSEPVVVIENLTKKFGEFTAVDDISMSVDRGRILGFIGPNGAGKRRRSRFWWAWHDQHLANAQLPVQIA